MSVRSSRRALAASAALSLSLAATSAWADLPGGSFTVGDLVISTVVSNTGADNSAGAIVLQQLALSADGGTASANGSLALPQTASGTNNPISGELGSSSEGFLQLSANGQYLTMMGYGVNADTFNAGGAAVYGNAALAQTTSVQGGTNTTVSRAVALIGANGSVDTSTAVYGIYDQNNPRSVATVDGTSFWMSGQGPTKGAPGEGIYYTTLGSSTATPVYTATDSRFVSIQNTGAGDTLYVSRDFKSKTDSEVDTVGTPGTLPTGAAGLTRVVPGTPSQKGNYSSVNVTAATRNGVNNTEPYVYLSPEEYFFADANTLYVADSGTPKNGKTDSTPGDNPGLGAGGLQKWSLQNGIWTLDYILSSGLNLVSPANGGNATGDGVTGLFGLTGQVVNGQVQLFATSYGLNDLSTSYLYEITDTLMATNYADVAGESFTTLLASAANTAIRGVSFAPSSSASAVPLPASALLLPVALAGPAALRRRRRA